MKWAGCKRQAAHPTEDRPEQADGQRGQPEHGPERAVDEPRDDDESCAGEGQRSDPQDCRQQVSVAACSERIQREMHDVHDQERDCEHDTVTAEHLGDG